MSSFGSQMRKRFNELAKAGANVPQIINEIAEGATIAAVDKAVEFTPPHNAPVAGTGMRTGEMAQSWQTDSITKPTNGKTVLANKMQYASYVNDGHHVDKHFVPGLILENGVLQKPLTGVDGGIMVGTKTTYVPGIYMKEKAIGKYRQVARFEVEKRIKEVFK